MCEDDEDQDYAVEAAGEDPVRSRKSLQRVFVQEGKKWLRCKRQNALKDSQEGEGFTDLVGLHELRHIWSACCGDGVPEHEQDEADVENPHLGEQRRGKLAQDGAEDGDGQDGGVSPLEDTTHEGDDCNLQDIIKPGDMSDGKHLTEEHEDGVESVEVAVVRGRHLVLQPVEHVADPARPAVDALAEDEYGGEADDEGSLAFISPLEDSFDPSNCHLGHRVEAA